MEKSTPKETTMTTPATFDATISDTEVGDRKAVIARIRTALKARTGFAWSVTGGRGTAYGWIRITAPKARHISPSVMHPTDQQRLAKALGTHVHHQGVLIPAGYDFRREYIDRAEGREPREIGVAYYD